MYNKVSNCLKKGNNWLILNMRTEQTECLVVVGFVFLSQNTCFERDVLLAITHKLVNTTKSLHA